MAAAWVCALVVKDIRSLPRLGYPSWFAYELLVNGGAAILEFGICLAIAGVISLIVVRPTTALARIWGGMTPFPRGLAWALSVGVILGLVMMLGTTHD